MYTMVDGSLLRTTAWTLTGSVDTSEADYTRTISGTNITGAHAVNVGQDGTGWYNDKNGGAITNGMIDDVGIWRRAVSPQEALAIYNGGQAGLHLALAQVGPPVVGVVISVTLSGTNVNFSWAGATGVRLQKSVNVNPSSWSDVAGTIGASAYSEPATNTRSFYRLFKP